MSDERLDALKSAVAEESVGYGSVRIEQIKINNYRFFAGEFALNFEGNNVLIYGENGSGKSSIYQAMELLASKSFQHIGADRNIFCDEGGPQVEFCFTNRTELIIDADMEELPEAFSFIKGLSVFTPMLDYKKLLRIHYEPERSTTAINLYDMLRLMLKDYPVASGRVLSDIKAPAEYFDALKRIINEDLLEEVNELIAYFSTDFKINQFYFEQKFTEDERSVEPVVRMDIDFMDNPITAYHTFLNEARLSALAIALYFAAIKRLLGTLSVDCLKILVLDDLLISLDMSNRYKLLNVLQKEFNAFQIFFFTHDRELFELYRAKLNWKCFELYLDESAELPGVLVKQGGSSLERAKEFYATKEFESCALLLRKALENILKGYLPTNEQRDKNCNALNLAGLISKAKSKSSGEAEDILEKLDIDRTHILNPLSHDDHRNTFSEEIKTALTDVQLLKDLLSL